MSPAILNNGSSIDPIKPSTYPTATLLPGCPGVMLKTQKLLCAVGSFLMSSELASCVKPPEIEIS